MSVYDTRHIHVYQSVEALMSVHLNKTPKPPKFCLDSCMIQKAPTSYISEAETGFFFFLHFCFKMPQNDLSLHFLLMD